MLEEETFFFYLKHYSQQPLLSGYTHPSTCGKGDRPSHRQKLHQRCFSTLVVRDKEDKVKQKKKGGCFMTTDSLKSYESRRAANQSNTGWWFSHLYIYTLPVQMKNSCLHNWSQRCNSAAITEKNALFMMYIHCVITIWAVFWKIWWICFYYLPKDSRTDGDMWQKAANYLENNLNKWTFDSQTQSGTKCHYMW